MLTLWESQTKMSLYNRFSWRQQFEDLIAPGENVPEECKRDTTILNISMLAEVSFTDNVERVQFTWGKNTFQALKCKTYTGKSCIYLVKSNIWGHQWFSAKFLSTLPRKQANPHPRVVWLRHYSRALDIQVATSTYSYLFPSLKKAQIKPSLVGK